MNEIENLVAQKDFENAKNLIKEELNKDPNDVNLLKNYGLCLVNLEENQQALETFLKVEEFDKEDATSLFYIASLYEKLKDSQKAIEYYKKVIELRENYIDAYKNLTMIYMNEKMVDEAYETAKKMNELAGETNDDYMVPFLYANILIYRKEMDSAVELLNKTLELNPEFIKAWNTIGCIMLSTHRLDESLKYFKKALSLNELDGVSQYNIATLYLVRGDYENAARHFKSAYVINPNEQTLSQAALAQYKAKKYEDAADSYKNLCTMNPQSLNYRFNYAICLYELKNYKQAISILLPIVQQNPKSAKIAHRLALCYEAEGQIRNAANIYEKILKLGNIPPEIYVDYAKMLVADKDSQKAENILKKVIQIKPDYALAHKDLGVIYLNGRLFDEAKDEFEEAIKLEPYNPMIVFEYANYNQAVMNLDVADKYYIQAEALMPDNNKVFLMHGLNKIKENDLTKANKILVKALSLHPKNHETLFALGQIAFSQKKYEVAKEYFMDAYVVMANAETCNMLALCYIELKNFHEAKILLNRINNAIPNNVSILTTLAKAEFLDNNPKMGKEYLDKVLEIFPESTEAQELLHYIQ